MDILMETENNKIPTPQSLKELYASGEERLKTLKSDLVKNAEEEGKAADIEYLMWCVKLGLNFKPPQSNLSEDDKKLLKTKLDEVNTMINKVTSSTEKDPNKEDVTKKDDKLASNKHSTETKGSNNEINKDNTKNDNGLGELDKNNSKQVTPEDKKVNPADTTKTNVTNYNL